MSPAPSTPNQKRGEIFECTPSEAVSRVFSQLIALPPLPEGPQEGRSAPVPIAYRLHDMNGGFDPEAPYCASWSYGNRTPTADCIGLVLWASKIDRKQPGYKGSQGEWLSCISIIDDARKEGRFSKLVGNDEVHGKKARPGDWLVNSAHIGMVIRPETEVSALLVIDCSPRHATDANRNAAIGIGRAWADDCIIVRPTNYRDA